MSSVPEQLSAAFTKSLLDYRSTEYYEILGRATVDDFRAFESLWREQAKTNDEIRELMELNGVLPSYRTANTEDYFLEQAIEMTFAGSCFHHRVYTALKHLNKFLNGQAIRYVHTVRDFISDLDGQEFRCLALATLLQPYHIFHADDTPGRCREIADTFMIRLPADV